VTEVYEVGGRRLGVRWSRAGLDAELRALATGALGLQDAPANLSIVLGGRTGRTRSKHQLHVQGQLSSMISGDGGLIRAVLRALGALAAEPQPGSLLLDAFLVLDPAGTVVAVDRRLAADVRRLGPVVRRRGRRIIQAPHLVVRPDRATAVLPDGPGAAGVSVEALDARWPLERGDDDLAAGEVAIARFVYAGSPEPESRGHAVADMVWMLRDPAGRVDRTEVAQLAALTAHVPVTGVLMQDRGRLAAVLGLS
jgi:hypothetical protein